MATLKDVAKLAGVSYNTVSLVVNNINKVAPETKERVLEAIKKLNYTPNKSARMLKGKSDTIAFISASFTSMPGINILKEIEEGIHLAGLTYNYDLIPYSTRRSIEIKEKILNAIVSGKKADVIIMLSIKPSFELLKRIKQNNITLILIDEVMEGVHTINTDNKKGAYLATEYLIKQGRKNILYIGGDTEKQEIGLAIIEREQGYIQALQEYGLEYKQENHLNALYYNIEEGSVLIEEVLKKNKKIDAVFCGAGDNIAVGVIEKLKKSGIKIPDDIAVIGYDDLPIASVVTPALTTVKQPIEKMGNTAFAIALEAMQKKLKEIVSKIFEAELIKRNSA